MKKIIILVVLAVFAYTVAAEGSDLKTGSSDPSFVRDKFIAAMKTYTDEDFDAVIARSNTLHFDIVGVLGRVPADNFARLAQAIDRDEIDPKVLELAKNVISNGFYIVYIGKTDDVIDKTAEYMAKDPETMSKVLNKRGFNVDPKAVKIAGSVVKTPSMLNMKTDGDPLSHKPGTSMVECMQNVSNGDEIDTWEACSNAIWLAAGGEVDCGARVKELLPDAPLEMLALCEKAGEGEESSFSEIFQLATSGVIGPELVSESNPSPAPKVVTPPKVISKGALVGESNPSPAPKVVTPPKVISKGALIGESNPSPAPKVVTPPKMISKGALVGESNPSPAPKEVKPSK